MFQRQNPLPGFAMPRRPNGRFIGIEAAHTFNSFHCRVHFKRANEIFQMRRVTRSWPSRNAMRIAITG